MYSSPASHWISTVVVAVLMSVMPHVPLPKVVDEWGAVIGRIAQSMEERYLGCESVEAGTKS